MQRFAKPRRTTVRIALIYSISVVLAVSLAGELRRRGGPFFQQPLTVEAHAWPGGNPNHDVIMLCRRARVLMPRGATVTVVRPSQAPDFEATYFLAAVGNLPRHRVVAPRLDAAADAPQYVIAVREPLSDRHYEKFAEFPEGTLWMRKP